MKKNALKYIISTTLMCTLLMGLTGCDFLDKILEPEQKEYAATIYNQTDKKDRNFNEYDGKQEDKKDEDVVEDSQEENLLVTPDPEFSYALTYDNHYSLAVSNDYYKITFAIPNEFVDYANIDVKKPSSETLNKDKTKYEGTKYKFSGNQGQTIKMLNMIYTIDKFDNYEDLIVMDEKALNKKKNDNDTKDIKEGNVVELMVNGTTNVAYRAFPYTSATGNSAIILISAQLEDCYLYSEIWLYGVYDKVDYESLIVNIYSNTNVEQIQELIIE